MFFSVWTESVSENLWTCKTDCVGSSVQKSWSPILQSTGVPLLDYVTSFVSAVCAEKQRYTHMKFSTL